MRKNNDNDYYSSIIIEKSEFKLDYGFYFPYLKKFYEDFIERDFLPDDYTIVLPFRNKTKSLYDAHANRNSTFQNNSDLFNYSSEDEEKLLLQSIN